MNTLQANINNDLLKDEEQLACLVEATNEIFTASEKDFEKMKAKKWYNRLWEMVTLSKDNEKVVVSNISNLSKLQEIVMKALLQLSNKNADIAEIIKTHADRLENISSNQYAIVKEIEKLKYGFDREIILQEVNDNKKHIIINMFLKFVGFLDKTENEDSQNYINAIVKNLNFSNIDVELPFDMIENLSKDEMRLLYQIMMEYCYTVEGEFIEDFEAFDYLELSGKNKKIVKDRIENMACLIGKRNLKERYEVAEPVWDIDIEGIEFSEKAKKVEVVQERKAEEYAEDGNILVMEVGKNDMFCAPEGEVELAGTVLSKISVGMKVQLEDASGNILGQSSINVIEIYEDTLDKAEVGDSVGLKIKVDIEALELLKEADKIKIFAYEEKEVKKEGGNGKNLVMKGELVDINRSLLGKPLIKIEGTILDRIKNKMSIRLEKQNGEKIAIGHIESIYKAGSELNYGERQDVDTAYIEIGNDEYQYLSTRKDEFDKVNIFKAIDNENESNILMEGEILGFDKSIGQTPSMSIYGNLINSIEEYTQVKIETENGYTLRGIVTMVFSTDDECTFRDDEDSIHLDISKDIYKNRKNLEHKRVKVFGYKYEN